MYDIKELSEVVSLSEVAIYSKLKRVKDLDLLREKRGNKFYYSKEIVKILKGTKENTSLTPGDDKPQNNQRVFELEQLLQTYQNEITSLNKLLQEKDERIQDLKDNLSRLDFLIGGINQTLDNQTDSIKLLRDKNDPFRNK